MPEIWSGVFEGVTDGTPIGVASYNEIPMMVFDENGNALIVEYDTHRIRRYDATAQTISRWAGQAGSNSYFGDYAAVGTALFSSPWLPVRIPGGHWLMGDGGNAVLRMIW